MDLPSAICPWSITYVHIYTSLFMFFLLLYLCLRCSKNSEIAQESNTSPKTHVTLGCQTSITAKAIKHSIFIKPQTNGTEHPEQSESKTNQQRQKEDKENMKLQISYCSSGSSISSEPSSSKHSPQTVARKSVSFSDTSEHNYQENDFSVFRRKHCTGDYRGSYHSPPPQRAPENTVEICGPHQRPPEERLDCNGRLLDVGDCSICVMQDEQGAEKLPPFIEIEKCDEKNSEVSTWCSSVSKSACSKKSTPQFSSKQLLSSKPNSRNKRNSYQKVGSFSSASEESNNSLESEAEILSQSRASSRSTKSSIKSRPGTSSCSLRGRSQVATSPDSNVVCQRKHCLKTTGTNYEQLSIFDDDVQDEKEEEHATKKEQEPVHGTVYHYGQGYNSTCKQRACESTPKFETRSCSYKTPSSIYSQSFDQRAESHEDPMEDMISACKGHTYMVCPVCGVDFHPKTPGCSVPYVEIKVKSGELYRET